ncbi:beta-propeller domain-containing protein, partial [Eubacterium ventriosum]
VAKNNESRMASSYDEIYKIMSEKATDQSDTYRTKATAKSSSSDSTISSDGVKKKSDSKAYSTTNIQTEGVDEGDVVKTDGEYIYIVNDKKSVVNIVKAQGKETKKIAKIKIKYNKEDLNVKEIYYADNKLIVISGVYEDDVLYGIEDSVTSKGCGVNNGKSITIISVYDITDRSNPKLIKQNTQQGDFDSSKLSGNYVYTISEANVNITDKKDSCVPEINEKPMDYSKIYLPNKIDGGSYTVITVMDINNPDKFYDQTAIAGNVQNVYVSENNIYLIDDEYEEIDISDTKKGKNILKKKNIGKLQESKKNLSAKEIKKVKKAYGGEYDWSKVTETRKIGYFKSQIKTNIVKYSYKDGKLNFVNENSVEGYVDSNLSFDEKAECLRFVSSNSTSSYVGERTVLKDGKGKIISENIVNTNDYEKYYEEEVLDNNVYVLDENLKEVASIKGLAKNESVYAVRYLGNYGYFVTYENTDPLFTVDFSDMKNPKIVGKLKLPGYSDYLHFYDENSMLGLGMENDNYLKLEMYNVSNGKAKQISKKVLKRYMYSDALHDYKSIIVDKEKNLIGFKATLSNGNYDDVYVLYRFENNKFKKLAEISLSGESYAVRGLYIDNYFYIVTLGKDVKVLDLNNYKVVKKLK